MAHIHSKMFEIIIKKEKKIKILRIGCYGYDHNRNSNEVSYRTIEQLRKSKFFYNLRCKWVEIMKKMFFEIVGHPESAQYWILKKCLTVHNTATYIVKILLD